MPGYLADKGHRILANGYNVISIKPGEKFPSIKDWRSNLTTGAMIDSWKANGRAAHGVGITTGKVVLADLDIYYPPLNRHMVAYVQTHVGFGAIRIGYPPKCGMLFRSSTPFKKITSKEFVDPQGRKAQIEILGEGQQFVAYAIHPDTGRPYEWTDAKENPEVTPASELTEITEAQGRAIVAEFERKCEELGWPLKSKDATAVVRQTALHPTPGTSVVRQTALHPDLDDPFFDIGNEPLGLTEEELRELVSVIPNDDVPYEGSGLTWLNMMDAIHDESGGAEYGYDIAYAWSDKSSKHTTERFDKTWNSLGKTTGRRVTARLLVKLAKEYRAATLRDQVNDLINSFEFAKDIEEIETVAAECRKLDSLSDLQRPRLVSALQAAYKHRTNTVLTIAAARDLIRFRPAGTPDWLDGWCYLMYAERFYDRQTGQMVTARAFDAAFGRFVGNDTTASKYALDTVKVPTAHMTIYLPAEGEEFTDQNGLTWINTYRDTSPAMPATWTRSDLRNVHIIENHFSHLFSDEREVELLISVLAYMVQTRNRINWMAILQGAEEIGKTFIAVLMNVILGGMPHVYKLDTEVLTKSPFTDWTAGHRFVFIEEIKVHGHQYDVMNKLKPLITDDTVSVHIKGMSPFNAPNITTYMGATNHKDAIPVAGGDTRYWLLQSRWQDPEKVAQFKLENPSYYPDLYKALEESPGAVRKFFLEYKLHPDFNPVGRAPHSHVKDVLIEQAKPEMQYKIEDLIEEGTPGVTNDIIVIHILRELLREVDESLIGPEIDVKVLASVLRGMGFNPCEMRRLKFGKRPNQKDYWIWSKNPELISATGRALRSAVEKSLLDEL
jgi:hypothetical protein